VLAYLHKKEYKAATRIEKKYAYFYQGKNRQRNTTSQVLYYYALDQAKKAGK
jgi:hypothetical protein